MRKSAWQILFPVALATGCATLNPSRSQVRFQSQGDAVSVHVAVQSVAPFEYYIDALQPQFSLTSAQALDLAITQTQAEESQVLRALSATLSVGLPSSTRSFTQQTDRTGSEVASSTTEVVERRPGAAPVIQAPPAALSNALAALTAPASATSIDQSIRYRTAASILQEVALWNNYVRDAAVRAGKKPYIVRLLVTLFPTARDEPYDVYSTMSFFVNESQEVKAANMALFPASEARDNLFLRMETWRCETGPVEVIPLFATDNMESSLTARGSERLLDLALAAGGTVQNVGGSVGIRKQAEAMERAQSRRLNSVLTIARPAENSVTARLGAVYSAGQYVMVPRTYNIILLVLADTGVKTLQAEATKAREYVERSKTLDLEEGLAREVVPCPEIAFAAQTAVRDAETGSLLRRADRGRVIRRLQSGVARVAKRDKDPAPLTEKLLEHAERGNFVGFENTMPANTTRAALELWSDFVDGARALGRSRGSFEVPVLGFQFPSDQAKASLIDDGTKMRLVLPGGSNLLPDRLSAAIEGRMRSGESLHLSSAEVSVGNDRSTATFTFPSVAHLKQKPDSFWATVRYSPGRRYWESGSGKSDYIWSPTVGGKPTPIGYFEIKPAPEADPGLELNVPSTHLYADQFGRGELSAELRVPENSKGKVLRAAIQVQGGFITGIENAVPEGADWIVPASGMYLLHLANLVPGMKLTVSATPIVEGKRASVSPSKSVDVIERRPVSTRGASQRND